MTTVEVRASAAATRAPDSRNGLSVRARRGAGVACSSHPLCMSVIVFDVQNSNDETGYVVYYKVSCELLNRCSSGAQFLLLITNNIVMRVCACYKCVFVSIIIRVYTCIIQCRLSTYVRIVITRYNRW